MWRKGVLLGLVFLVPMYSASAASQMDESRMNRLQYEKSPYLLQHASNPVDWYPWSDKAFEKARQENKPIFLSIGYSTCHWCHVMAHESFEDQEIATYLNEHFVAIKVDREERPDIDATYMRVVQMMTGGGGWPLNVFLTPQGKAFYGGTYFPPEDKWGRPGMLTLAKTINTSWKEDKDKVLSSAAHVQTTLEQAQSRAVSVEATVTHELLLNAFEQIAKASDGKDGGVGAAPKFPMMHIYLFMARYYARTKDAKALALTERALQKIGTGGIYDQLNGGVHRYSVDAVWRVPHFEKMLYDQALAVRAFTELFQVTKNEVYRTKAAGILEFVRHSMRGDHGAFYSALDADSAVSHDAPEEKKEGVYYVWQVDDIKRLLGPDAELFSFLYGLEEKGNMLSDPHNEFGNANVLHQAQSIAQAAKKYEKSVEDIERIVERSHGALLSAQKMRPFPHIDDKVLTDWNGLMISAYAYAGRVFGDAAYIVCARTAANFILETLKDEKGNLMHRYRDGDIKVNGFLTDYAFFQKGLLELYFATHETEYLEEALSMADVMVELFWDKENKGFYSTRVASDTLARTKEYYDGAIPSANAVAAESFLTLSRIADRDDLQEVAQGILMRSAALVEENPIGHAYHLIGMESLLSEPMHIVFTSPDSRDQGSKKMLQRIKSAYQPHAILILKTPENVPGVLIPFAAPYKTIDGKTTVFFCEGFTCKKPIQTFAELEGVL